MCITLNNGEFSYELYEKREDYAFEIIRYPNISGNIPFNPAYGIFVSQCKLFAEVNSSVENFISDIYTLQSRLVNQGFTVFKLQGQI